MDIKNNLLATAKFASKEPIEQIFNDDRQRDNVDDEIKESIKEPETVVEAVINTSEDLYAKRPWLKTTESEYSKLFENIQDWDQFSTWVMKK